MTTLVITRGVPASGKTTWAKSWVAESPETRARVNRDDIRYSTWGKGWGVDELAVTRIQNFAITDHLKHGTNVVVDNTNLRAASVKDLLRVARDAKATVEFRDFLIEQREAVARDKLRALKGENAVGEDVIARFFSKFISKGKLPAIPVLEDSTPRFATYVPDGSLPSAYGIDLDGTLAHMSGRSPYDPTKYHEDTVDRAVLSTVWALSHVGAILIFTGRSEEYRGACEEWLISNGVPYDALIMRKSGDTRKDDIVKSELFDEYVAPNYNFIAQFDDRNRVVEMFRARGIKCYQVEKGDF